MEFISSGSLGFPQKICELCQSEEVGRASCNDVSSFVAAPVVAMTMMGLPVAAQMGKEMAADEKTPQSVARTVVVGFRSGSRRSDTFGRHPVYVVYDTPSRAPSMKRARARVL